MKKGRKRPLSYKTFARAAQIIAIFSEIFFTNPVKNLPKSVIVFIICAEKVYYKVCNACYKVSNTCYKVCNAYYKLCNKKTLIGKEKLSRRK